MNTRLIFLLALLAGGSFYFTHWIWVADPWLWIWKGSGVGLLALWAGTQARSLDGWLIAAVLALGALGDVLLETHGLSIGAVAFLAGHLLAVGLYLRNREAPVWHMAVIATAVTLAAFVIPFQREAAPAIALYSAGLGLMAGAARISRFPRYSVALGAMLFVLSDMLIFARIGFLETSAIPGLLIWPTYFIGQALIAWGVVTTLARDAR